MMDFNDFLNQNTVIEHVLEEIEWLYITIRERKDVFNYIQSCKDPISVAKMLESCAHLVKNTFPMFKYDLYLEYSDVDDALVFRVIPDQYEPLEPINNKILKIYDILYPEYNIKWLDKLYITVGR